jgi:hypothetical protein
MVGRAGGIVVITADYFIFGWSTFWTALTHRGCNRRFGFIGNTRGVHGWQCLNPVIVGMLPCSLAKLLQERGVC